MTASADKVQYLLENCLEESVPLVRKGIFSQQELQSIMLRRQKCEHSMLKRQYQMTDYLGAIEYQYELERERRKRMAQIGKLQEGSNPLFRKESSADFAIVKRIIRLWDRAMHKYKFQVRLWKQYLSFCIAIKSKKHFYTTLTNGLRFLPYEVDLWKIGASYEMEHGLNMWKGRKILIKGLKMVPQGSRNLSLAQFMVSYELTFLRKLTQRQRILMKGEEPLKMIGGDEEQNDSQEEEKPQQIQTMNLEDYDSIIWVIIEETISKNSSSKSEELSFSKISQRFKGLLRKQRNQEEADEVKKVISKVIERLNNFQPLQGEEILMKEESKIKVEGVQVENKELRDSNDLNLWKERMVDNQSAINWKTVKQALSTFCLKPNQSADILNYLLLVNPSQTIGFLSTQRPNRKLPPPTLSTLISISLEGRTQTLSKLVIVQVDRWITPLDLREEPELFEKITKFNAKQGRFESTTRILRSISIAYRSEPDYLAFCNKVSNHS